MVLLFLVEAFSFLTREFPLVSIVKLVYLFISLVFFCLFTFSGAAPVACVYSQARGLIRAVATHLCQSHSNEESEPCLQPTPQLKAMPYP